MTRSDIAQIGITTAMVDHVWYDNIYLHKNTVLATNSFNISNFKMYPNPAKEILNISCDSIIDEIKIYNTLGQMVSKQLSSSNEASVNIGFLAKGVYIITAQVGNDLIRKQFIKE